MSKYYIFTKFCYLSNSNKSNQNVVIQQTFMTTICVNRLNKNTTYVPCNRSIRLTDIDGQLIRHILHKGSSINSDLYHCVNKDIIITTYPLLKLVIYPSECHDVKVTNIEFNNFCNKICILFYNKHAR